MKEVSQTTPDVLYTVKEVAELLKTNIDYVHKIKKSGASPVLKDRPV